MSNTYKQVENEFILSTNPNILNHQKSWLMDVLNVWTDSEEDEETVLNMLEDLGINTTGLDVYNWPGCKYELTNKRILFISNETGISENVGVIIKTLLNKFNTT